MHFTESHDDCSLCDVHSLSIHTAQSFYIICSFDEHSEKIIFGRLSFFSQPVSTFTNKGPPAISSIIA